MRLDELESNGWELQATLQLLYQIVGALDDTEDKRPFHGIGAQHIVDQFVHVLEREGI